MKDKENNKPDIACKGVYPAIARSLLFDMHNNSLEMIEKGLPTNKPKNLVVVGPGTEVIPFSENLETVVRMLGGGNLILMDYNKDIAETAPEYLALKGFDKHFVTKKVNGSFDPKQAKNTLFVETRDIKQGYGFPDESVSGIDMTVAIHHVTQYESDLAQFCEDAFNALIPGGILHIGEGNVDMKYSERKIGSLSQDLIDSGEKGVKVIDTRYQDSEPRELYFGNQENPIEVEISNTGMVKISLSDISKTVEFLKDRNYKQIFNNEKEIIVPLIDHAIEEDFQGMVVPVRNYYGEIMEECSKRIEPEYFETMLKAISKERSDAERGLVEFYSPPKMVIKNLRKAGFAIEETKYTKCGPFVNILAKKPTK